MDLEKQALATLLALAIVGAPAVASDWKVSLVAGEQRLAAHDLPGAEEYFRQALAAVKRQKHSRAELAQCMERLADVLQQLSETDEVIPLYKKALAIETAAKSPRVLPVLLSLGKVYSAEGNYKQAGKTFERAVNAAGSNAIAAAECRRLLGNAEQQLGNLAKAEQCYKDALSALMSEQALPSIDSLHATLSDYLDLFLKSDEHQRNIASSFQKELLKDDLGDIARTQSAQQSFFSKEVSGRLAKDGPA
jgi:tetratricopeptide (TPR) repeat protein